MENATARDCLVDYMDAGFPILYVRTYEEDKADQYIAEAAGRRDVYEWNGADGFVNFKTRERVGESLFPEPSLERTLDFLYTNDELDGKVLVIKDASALLSPHSEERSSRVIALLKQIGRAIRRKNDGIDTTVIIVSPTVQIPPELQKLITILELEPPSETEIAQFLVEFAEENMIACGPEDFQADLVTALKGLSISEIQDILNLALTQEDDLTIKTLQLIFEQKQQMVLKAGLLELIPQKENLEDIGGLDYLKRWLKRKAAIFTDMKAAKAYGVRVPKGVLIAGVPGCGKSLSAKAAGNLFGVPLLRLDMGLLMGKYIGESEQNLRNAIRLAEAMAPCVLWVDELEKAFAGVGNGGHEVTARLFGQFLTWMQEKNSATFVVATANNISQLPSELLRKGRFDDIFYVDLPDQREREKILRIHLTKRRENDALSINFGKIAEETEGYSGADLEGIINDSVEFAFGNKMPAVTTSGIMARVKETQPLSKIMKDSIEKMRKMYKERGFRPASRNSEAET